MRKIVVKYGIFFLLTILIHQIFWYTKSICNKEQKHTWGANYFWDIYSRLIKEQIYCFYLRSIKNLVELINISFIRYKNFSIVLHSSFIDVRWFFLWYFKMPKEIYYQNANPAKKKIFVTNSIHILLLICGILSFFLTKHYNHRWTFSSFVSHWK